jgi:hypothetical protein
LGTHLCPAHNSTYFDIALLREEVSRAAILDAWNGTQPPPSHNADWPGWLEAAIERVLKRNGELAKERKREKGARIRDLQHKTQLAEN